MVTNTFTNNNTMNTNPADTAADTNTNIVQFPVNHFQNEIATITAIPLDAGMSSLAFSNEDQIILADGSIRTLTGTDEDLAYLAYDRGVRLKQTLFHVKISGLNMQRARDFYIKTYDDGEKLFWETMTKLTGFSKKKLADEIRISEAYSDEEINLLQEQKVTTTVALKFASKPAARKELLQIAAERAEEGTTLSNKMAMDLLEEESGAKDKATESKQAEKPNNEPLPLPELSVPPILEPEIKEEAALIPQKLSEPQAINAIESSIENVLSVVNLTRFAYEISTVRGEVSRKNGAWILAAHYGIPVPSELPPEGEEEVWLQDLRAMLPEDSKNKLKIGPLYFIAFVEGWIAFLQGEKSAPKDYESLLTQNRVKDSGLKAIYRFWNAGRKMAKERNL